MSNILKGLTEGYFSRDENDQQNAMDTRRSSDLSRERNVGLDEPDELPATPAETRNGVYEYNVPAGQEDIAQELGLQSHRGHWVSRIPVQRANFQFGRPQFHEIPSKSVTEGSNDTIYPNAEVIKSKNGKPVGEIYQDGNSWGAFHYRADRGYDFIDSREEAIEALKDLHQETGRSRPNYTIKGVAEGANADSQIKRIKDRILQLKDWNTAGTHDKKIKELQAKLKELQKQGVAEGSKEQEYGPEWDEKVKRLGQMAKQGERKTVWDPVKRVYKTVPVNPPKEQEVEEGQIYAGGNKPAGVRWYKPRSVPNQNELSKESAIMKGLQLEGNDEEHHTGGGLGTPYPSTYEQETLPYRTKGQKRTQAIAFENKKVK